jgi:hypothetical protein
MVMIEASPVAHLHYFTLSAILILGLQARVVVGGGWWVAGGAIVWYGWLVLYFAAQLIPNLPGMEATRDFGLVMYAGLGLWLIGCITLAFTPRIPIAAQVEFKSPLHSAA